MCFETNKEQPKPTTTQPMTPGKEPLVIQEGKYYKSRDGRVFGPAKPDSYYGKGAFELKGTDGDHRGWFKDGTKYQTSYRAYGPEWDLVEECDKDGKPVLKSPAPEGEQKADEVVLKLTKEEAEVIRDMAAKFGGVPTSSRRKHVETVVNKLEGLGFKRFDFNTADMEGGSIYFRDLPKPPFTISGKPGSVFKTRKGTLVQFIGTEIVHGSKRTHTMKTLGGSSNVYGVHSTGEAHEDKSTCPDDVIEAVSLL